mgnify:FL=1
MDRPDPIWAVLREQGRYNLVWLAGRTGYSHSHVKAFASGARRPSARFRAGCARLLGMPEFDLFLHDGSNASQPEGSPDTGRDSARADTVGAASIPA